MSFVKCCFEIGEAHDFFDSLVQKCTDPGCCCGCCSALRPRYKRLVDNIFPANPQDGLVKSNMEKLTFYSLSSPEKLDRIGEYLFQKASRDISRRRHGFVIIAMEAMDQLLLACHSQTLNLFVESFLKMVQKLLESTDPQLQILATQSFVRFANIEEDTPSYHRRYDFFVSKFSAMCHSNHSDKVTRDKIRLAGIQGLQGVIRKTVSDDLVENIWEAQHMDKIVPSLLYNMQSSEKYSTVCIMESNGECEDTPPKLAETCLRELVGRASFGHIRCVLGPVLTHFDRHDLWVPNDFAVHVFKIIMFSIQAAYSYSVVESLMSHLEAGGGAGRAGLRAARAGVLASIVDIAAGDSVGPSVLEIINTLLTNLRASVAREEKEPDEKLYQEALINALGEFADHLPDFQKIDIMMFIVSKIPAPSKGKGPKPDAMLQSILLKSLLKVGSTYQCVEYPRALPAALLGGLLRLAGGNNGAGGGLALLVLQHLLDRRGNKPALSTPRVNYAELGLTVEKPSRSDLIFISKHGYTIYSALYDGLQLESNTIDNINGIFTTLALICCELGCEETLQDLIQLVLAIQQSALSNPVLSRAQKNHLHCVVISLMCLITHVMHLPRLADYVEQIVKARSEDAPYLLPPLQEDYEDTTSPSKTPYLMVDQLAVCECVPSWLDVSTVCAGFGAGIHGSRDPWLQAGAGAGRDSLADIAAPVTELDSANSSPGVARPQLEQYDALDEEYRMFVEKYNKDYRPHWPEFGTYHPMQIENISLEALRRVAVGPSDADKREDERRKAVLNNTFRTAPFDHLMQLTQPKYELKEKLEEIFNSISSSPPLPTSPTNMKSDPPPHQKYFPELFLY